MCGNFGSYVYRVELHKDARRVGLPFGDFQRLTGPMEDFSDLIMYLCSECDAAYLIDANPYVGEVIVMNFDCIETFTNVTGEELKDERIPLKLSQRSECTR